MPESRPLLVTLPITPKTYDIDFAAIVHNMVYIRWLEDLRTALLVASHYPIEAMLADGFTPILTQTEIAYQRPVRFGDTVTGRMWLSHLGRTKWTVQAEIVTREHTAVTATQHGYFADLKTLRPIRVPEQLRALYNARAEIEPQSGRKARR